MGCNLGPGAYSGIGPMTTLNRAYTLAVAHQGHKLVTINEAAAGNEHVDPPKPVKSDQPPIKVGDRVRDLFGRHSEGWVVSTFYTTSGRTLHGVELDDGTVLIFPTDEVERVAILHQLSELKEGILVCERCGCSESAIRYFGWWVCNPKRLLRKEGPYLAGRPS